MIKLPIRIVVGKKFVKKIRIHIQEFTAKAVGEKERIKNSENIVLYDEEGVIDIKELAKDVEKVVTDYERKKGDVEKY